MCPASKTSLNTRSHRIGEVDATVRFDPKMMVKEDITEGNREEKKTKKQPYLPWVIYEQTLLSLHNQDRLYI